jgi:hypothetical protein
MIWKKRLPITKIILRLEKKKPPAPHLSGVGQTVSLLVNIFTGGRQKISPFSAANDSYAYCRNARQ